MWFGLSPARRVEANAFAYRRRFAPGVAAALDQPRVTRHSQPHEPISGRPPTERIPRRWRGFVGAGGGRGVRGHARPRAAPLYWPAPPQPGVPILIIEGHPVAPIFSSEAELTKLVGPSRWLSTDGLRFLSLLPAGVTVGLDIASAHRLRLDPAAVRLEYALALPVDEEAGTASGTRTERR